MCGICGAINLSQGSRIEFGLVRAMADLLRHRGPDDEGYHVQPDVGLGHRRLSIIDLETGRQPIYSEDETVCVVFNGEIYNFRELRGWLERRGHAFYTRTDTETIVHLYEEFGPAAFQRLRGMFAFALWDGRRKELHLVRDRFGIKPLYVMEYGGRLYFASEIKAFLAVPGWNPDLDFEALYQYLTWMFTPGEATLFRGVRKVRPGSYLRIPLGGRPQEVIYYSLGAGAENGFPDHYYLDELRKTLVESIRMRMVADVPVGAFLSGGVDSSLVTAVMASLADGPLHTFSVGFAEEDFNELPYARMVAEYLGTQHHEAVVGAEDVREHAREAIYYRDEPLAYPSEVPTLLLSRLAARYVKVVLSGEGGDELFAGYPKYIAEGYGRWLSVLPDRLRRGLLGTAARRLPFAARRLQIALNSLALSDPAARWTRWFAAFDEEAKQDLISVSSGLQPRPSWERTRQMLATAPFDDDLRRHLWLDVQWWLPDNLLQKGDKMSMAASLEARVPLLDQELVELAFSMPGHMKVKGQRTKIALRRLLGEVLPPEIRDRKKVGFALPIGRWFRNEWRNWARELLTSCRTRQRGFFRPAAVEKILREHERGVVDRQRELWVLVNFELWCRLFLDGEWREFVPSRRVSNRDEVADVQVVRRAS